VALVEVSKRWSRAFCHDDAHAGPSGVAPHYDLGAAKAMLDTRHMRFCAPYGEAARRRQDARRRLDLITTADAGAGMRVLDIGYGWGGWWFAATRYGVSVTGVTLPREQFPSVLARPGAIYSSGLPRRQGQFGRVVSVGCLEHRSSEPSAVL
jgi:cyclopropane fatty-acyl-phospholipid synthase-like methyltransferase